MTGRRRWTNRRLAPVLGALLLAGPLVAACGADAVDRSDEVRVLVDTCRSIQERGRTTLIRPLDADALARAFARTLASEPGRPGEGSVATTLREVCLRAIRDARPEPTPLLPERPGS